MKKISIIVPCFNEEATVELFYDALTKMWWDSTNNLINNYEPEIIFIDDGSKDKTYKLIKALSEAHKEVHFVSFSRNFGKEAAMFCGLKQCSGDAAIVIDADLQHPVETIKDMLLKWEEGYEIIEGIKKARGKEKKTHGFFANLFYKIISKVTGFDMANSSDFKLIDRKVIDALNDFEETETFFRALTFWTGFRNTTVEYEVAERVAGVSKWSTSKLIKYAVKNLTSFTYMPLFVIAYVGILVLIIGVILGIDAIISYFLGKAVGGYPSLVILITFATGAILISLGIIAVYIAKIYQEVKNRPRYIIGDSK